MRWGIGWLAGLALLALPAAALAGPPPANDSTAGATVVPALPAIVSGVTTDATMDANEPAPLVITESDESVGLDRSVWFAYTADRARNVLADTCDANFDNHVDVYTGTPAALTPVATRSNDFSDCPGDRRSFAVTAGTTYFIRVTAERSGNRTPDGGVFHLKLDPQQPPPNDAFANSILLPGAGTGAFTAPLAFSTLEFGEPSFSDDRGSVWYRLVPPASQAYTVSLPTQPFQVRVAVFQSRGAAIDRLRRLTSDFADSEETASVSFNALHGQAYYVRLSTDRAIAGDAGFDVTTNTATGLGLVVTPAANSMKSIRRAGLRAVISCARSCRLGVELLVARSDAKRYHLAKKPRGPIAVGHVTGRLQTGEATTATVPLSASARRHLAHAHPVHFVLRVSVVGSGSRPVDVPILAR